jgi:hypothetical protein
MSTVYLTLPGSSRSTGIGSSASVALPACAIQDGSKPR